MSKAVQKIVATGVDVSTHPFRVRPDLLADSQCLKEELQRGSLELLLRSRRDFGSCPIWVGFLDKRDREVPVGGRMPIVVTAIVIPKWRPVLPVNGLQ